MNIVPYNPFEAGRQLNKIFDNFFNQNLTDFLGSDISNFGPSANVYETETAFFIELATPGFSRDQLNLEVQDTLLTIRGDVADGNTDNTYLRREFSREPFVRTYQLPDDVESTGVQANYENGILTMTLPKRTESPQSASRKIEIK